MLYEFGFDRDVFATFENLLEFVCFEIIFQLQLTVIEITVVIAMHLDFRF